MAAAAVAAAVSDRMIPAATLDPAVPRAARRAVRWRPEPARATATWTTIFRFEQDSRAPDAAQRAALAERCAPEPGPRSQEESWGPVLRSSASRELRAASRPGHEWGDLA